MYSSRRSGSRGRAVNIWPGFVDALATLLMVVIFVLMVFMIAQFFLSRALTGRDAALEQLNQEISELAELLALERAANADLRINVAQLSSELQTSLAQRETLGSQVNGLLRERDEINQQLAQAQSQTSSLSEQLAALVEDKEQLEKLLNEAEQVTQRSKEELEAAYKTIEADKAKIEAQLSELAILKSLRDDMTEQLAQMEGALAAQEESSEALRQRMGDLERQLGSRREEAEILADQAAKARADAEQQRDLAVALQARAASTTSELEKQTKLTDEAQIKVELLNRQIAALRQQLARISAALEETEAKNAEKEVQIADLGRRLNVALATKVQELARYRSEFFGRLRELLGERKDIRIVGDRFVFQSELFFETGSAELGEAGKEQLSQLADTLIEVASQIPTDLEWILRVDGHTDDRPIVTADFPSNWELSTARAVSVVHFLVSQGIPPTRLAATGFGEFQPVDKAENEEAYRKNRRIELRFTQR